jgi:hypothetical protein
MIQFRLKDKPNHPIVKAIKEYEPNMYSENDLIVYSPHFDSTCGWTIEGHFLGFTKTEVVETYKRNAL